MEKKYQIFISSTYEDLKEERKKVQDTILSMYQFPIGMEMFSAADEEQWEIIKETIDSSDYYILIIGHRYGSVIKEGEYAGISYTQKEFRYALEKKIPVLAFFIDNSVSITPEKMEQDIDKKKELEKFKDEVKTGRLVEWWENKYDLANKVTNALNKQISRKDRPGWIRTQSLEKDKNHMSKELREECRTVSDAAANNTISNSGTITGNVAVVNYGTMSANIAEVNDNKLMVEIEEGKRIIGSFEDISETQRQRLSAIMDEIKVAVKLESDVKQQESKKRFRDAICFMGNAGVKLIAAFSGLANLLKFLGVTPV